MEEKSPLYITDEQITNVLKRLDDVNDETALSDAIKTLLIVTADTRRFLRHVYKEMPKKTKVYKKPTGNKEDIVVGGFTLGTSESR